MSLYQAIGDPELSNAKLRKKLTELLTGIFEDPANAFDLIVKKFNEKTNAPHPKDQECLSLE